MELGDAVERALIKVGITQERVSAWIGRPCGCEERKQKLNQLSSWAKMVIKDRLPRHRQIDIIHTMMEEEQDADRNE